MIYRFYHHLEKRKSQDLIKSQLINKRLHVFRDG